MITFTDIKAAWRSIALVAVVIIIAVLCILLANSRSDVAAEE
jgi:hypothetical protein